VSAGKKLLRLRIINFARCRCNSRGFILGRLSEIVWYLNAEKIPDKLEQQHYYRYLDVDDPGLKKMRREYRRGLKKGKAEIRL